LASDSNSFSLPWKMPQKYQCGNRSFKAVFRFEWRFLV
jgi:hypothetical protein